MPRTKILATLGPATASEASVRALVDAGASAFRLDFSRGGPVDAVLSRLRDGAVQPGAPVVLIGGWPFGGGSVASFVHVTTL